MSILYVARRFQILSAHARFVNADWLVLVLSMSRYMHAGLTVSRRCERNSGLTPNTRSRNCRPFHETFKPGGISEVKRGEVQIRAAYSSPQMRHRAPLYRCGGSRSMDAAALDLGIDKSRVLTDPKPHKPPSSWITISSIYHITPLFCSSQCQSTTSNTQSTSQHHSKMTSQKQSPASTPKSSPRPKCS